MRTPTNKQKHDAGRHLVVGEALIRGHGAEVDGPSSYVKVDGHRVQVQVAAQGAWQIDDVDRYTSATVQTVLLVDLTNGSRDFYVCPGDQLRERVRRQHDHFLASQGGKRPRNPDSRHAALYPDLVADWLDNWAGLR